MAVGTSEKLPVWVRAVEDPADAARAREREARSDRHDAEDLDAQLRSAAAAEYQARLSLISLIVSSAGVIGVLWTVKQSREATAAAVMAAQAAQRSAEVSEATASPIVVPRVVEWAGLYPPKGYVGPLERVGVAVALENHGTSPAFMVSSSLQLVVSRDDPVDPLPPVKPNRDRTVLPAHCAPPEYRVDVAYDGVLDRDEVARLNKKLPDGGTRFFLVARLVYDDVAGQRHVRGYCLKVFRTGVTRARGDSRLIYFERQLATDVVDAAERDDDGQPQE